MADANSYVFQLKLAGAVVAEYGQCRGLGSCNDIEESTSAGGSGLAVIQKSPGALRWPNIVLRRKGLSDGNVWSWRQAMTEGNLDVAIRDGEIVVLQPGFPGTVARWQFQRGWAASLILDGTVEELTIVHEGLSRVAPSDGTHVAVRPTATNPQGLR